MSNFFSIIIFLILVFHFHSQPNPFIFEEEVIDIKGLEQNLTGKYNNFKSSIKKRHLSSGEPIYMNPVITTVIYNNSFIQTLTFKLKAKGDISEINLYDICYSEKTELLLCELKIKDNNDNDITLGENDKCLIRELYYIDINVDLKNEYTLSVKIQLLFTYNPSEDVIYYNKRFYIPPMFSGIKSLFLFNVDPSIVFVKFSSGKSYVKPYNSTAFIFDDICPDSVRIVGMYFTPYEMKWSFNSETIFDVKSKTDYINIWIHKDFTYGGNIFNIVQDQIKTNIILNDENDELSEFEDEIDIILYNVPGGKYYYKYNITFSTRPINWIVPEFLEEKIRNISTSETISLAKRILEEDESTNPDYYKLGSWVYKYMTYNISAKYSAYNNISNYLSQVISRRQGVCAEYTYLYNALLNSIGIEAIYISGETFYKYTYNSPYNINEKSHAWTLAKIDNKWIPLDATWNLFEGVFPQNHIFRIRYGEPSYTAYNIAYNGLIKGDVDFEYKYDFKFLEIVQNPVIENEDNNIDDVSNNDDSIDKSIHNEEDGGSSSYNDDYSENSSCNRYISWTKKLILLPFL